eukprot:4740352-Amphidinium_carterae.1
MDPNTGALQEKTIQLHPRTENPPKLKNSRDAENSMWLARPMKRIIKGFLRVLDCFRHDLM